MLIALRSAHKHASAYCNLAGWELPEQAQIISTCPYHFSTNLIQGMALLLSFMQDHVPCIQPNARRASALPKEKACKVALHQLIQPDTCLCDLLILANRPCGLSSHQICLVTLDNMHDSEMSSDQDHKCSGGERGSTLLVQIHSNIHGLPGS